MKLDNRGFGFVLCFILFTVQACAPHQKLQTTPGASIKDTQAFISRATGARIGKARLVKLVSVNDKNVDSLHGNVLSIPVGSNRLRYLVEWSNGFSQEDEIAFDAKEETTYRLSGYELKRGERMRFVEKNNKSGDGSFSEALGYGLFFALSPIIILTIPVWLPVTYAVKSDKNKLPFENCCYIWVEEVTDTIEVDAVPEELATQSLQKVLLERASQGETDAQYGIFLFMRNEYLEPVAAWEWLCKAADKGYEKAQLQVAYWHRESNWKLARSDRIEWLNTANIRADDRIAYLWYTLAAKGNDKRLRIRDNLFYGLLSGKETVEAKDMVRNWKPGQCPTPYK